MKRLGLLLLVLITNSWMWAQSNDHDALGGGGTPIDTLKTNDKYVQIILFDDHTWDYLYLEKPDIDESELTENWDNVSIHAYKEISLEAMPDSVELSLTDETHTFCIPIKGKVYSRYGWRGKRPHRGVDIPLTTGDSIHAAFDGIVRISEGSSQTGGYGNLVIIRHPNGLETYYGHLSKILVKENEIVAAGEVIGLGGSTGRSTGPHLHFETRYLGKAFDPERVVDWENNCLRDTLLVVRKAYYNPNSHYNDKVTASTSSSSSTTTAKPSSSSSPVYYTIRKGDNLGKIAKKYHTTVSKLCKLNKIKETTTLQIGRRLRVK